jgi:uncharacterized protein YllA (UPF0747 family)
MFACFVGESGNYVKKNKNSVNIFIQTLDFLKKRVMIYINNKNETTYKPFKEKKP